jgi:hypothetical protein
MFNFWPFKRKQVKPQGVALPTTFTSSSRITRSSNVAASPQPDRSAHIHDDSSLMTNALLYSMLADSSRRTPSPAPEREPEPYKGGGGSFDGAGASGDWSSSSSSSSCSDSSSSYSSSDSSSSCSSDSGSSSSGSD